MFKVLIVDDEEQIRRGLCTIVPWESFGFVVAGEAADGEEALETAQALKPDLVVTDIKMPEMDGIGLARELRSKYPEMPVLFLSGYNEFTYAKEALKYGVSDYLLKPVDPEELGRVLEQVYGTLLAGTRRKAKEKEKEKSLRGHFLGKLMRGEIYGDPAAAADEYGLSLREGLFSVMIVSMDRDGESARAQPQQEIGLIKFALENILEELLGQEGWLFEMDERKFGILLAGLSLEEQDFRREMARRIVENARRYAKESLTVACGRVVRDPARIRESYEQARKAMDLKGDDESEHVFLYDPLDFEEGPGRARKTENRIREIVEHIDKHYNTDLNLKELSKMFYINAVYLGQLFKKETGEFFNDYLNKVRIREACKLLERTDLPAAEIAEKAGYKYVDHFYRHFRQIHGMSPGEYRQKKA